MPAPNPLPAGLPLATLPLLGRVGAVAAGRGVAVCLVGGTVRDLLLGRPLRDVDLLVAGDAGLLAQAAALGTSLQVRAHARFGTARLWDPGTGATLDLASARQERYRQPGALPVVQPASLAADLTRRDFSINAMALPLRADGVGELLDPHGGRLDLQRKLVRVLHPGSFLDDPTRAYRAVRLGVRLGFRPHPSTSRWLREAVAAGAVARLSPARLAAELARVAAEVPLAALLNRLARRGLLAAIHPALSIPDAPGAGRRLSLLLDGAPAAVRLLALVTFLLQEASPADLAGALTRLQLPAGGRRRLPGILATARTLATGDGGPPEGRQDPGSAGEGIALLVAAAWCRSPDRRRDLARIRRARV
jgi:tRNA nucleotidyltransferase (CCA-adding enzyme)